MTAQSAYAVDSAVSYSVRACKRCQNAMTPTVSPSGVALWRCEACGYRHR